MSQNDEKASFYQRRITEDDMRVIEQ